MENEMNATNWLATGAIGGIVLGAITALWGRIKSFMWTLCSFFVSYVEIKDDHTSKALLNYLLETYKRSKLHDRTYGGNYEHTRDGKYGLIPYEYLEGKTLVFWNGWKPLIYGVQRAQPPSQSSTNYWWGGNASKDVAKTVMFFRGTYDVEAILKEAVSSRNHLHWNSNKSSKNRRFFIKKVPDAKEKAADDRYSVGTNIAWYQEGVYRLLQHNVGELGRQQPGNRKALDMLIFPDRIKKLINEIKIWRNYRYWFVERGIPWKRGWILYGPPGTGKSILVRAFAEDEDMPLFIFSLGEMHNSELQKCWDEMQAHVPCIALFEDLDNVFHGRTNVWSRDMNPMVMMNSIISKPIPHHPPSPEADKEASAEKSHSAKIGMLSFDCLLNCIDGAGKEQGVFTVITTNHIDKIDPALGVPRKLPDGTMEFISTRPGRIDKAIELTYMEINDKIEMAQRILGEYPDGLKKMIQFVHKWGTDLQETPAQFQERCSQLAQSYFWKEIANKEGFAGMGCLNDIEAQVLTVNGMPLEGVSEKGILIPGSHT